jgi:hypothetical protein
MVPSGQIAGTDRHVPLCGCCSRTASPLIFSEAEDGEGVASDDDPNGIAAYSQQRRKSRHRLILDAAAHLPIDVRDPDD